MRNLLLIGMPGTGKSTVSAMLAKRLGLEAVDTDRCVEQACGRCLPEILAAKGVEGFLSLEGSVGESLICDRCVIATGGSMVYSVAAMENLMRNACTVWLDTPLAMLEHRVARGGDRGIAAPQGTTIAQLYTERTPLYQRYADIRVACVGSAEQVTATVMQALVARGVRFDPQSAG